MATLRLKDKQVNQGDFVQLTIDLQLTQAGTCVTTGSTKSYNGKIELHDPAIEYDETKVSEADIEKIAKAHGFEKR